MDILIKPLVTEKMTAQGERFNRYGFVVDRKATKVQIKKAVESLYSVSVDTSIPWFMVAKEIEIH
jgi:large subunit ribosomal protein L23